MDYLIEAKKFIKHARHADNPDVTETDLEMAEWLLCREIEERDHASWLALSMDSSTKTRPRSCSRVFCQPILRVDGDQAFVLAKSGPRGFAARSRDARSLRFSNWAANRDAALLHEFKRGQIDIKRKLTR
jgi:hypothetical protein